jgi:uncharacterized protein YbjT (DUF2867 family)
MRVLMIGATGASAGMVLPELVRRGVEVRALVRDQQKASDALSRGAAETALGDLRDPASLRAAAEGMEGVFHIGPAFAADESAMGVSMVEAAVAAGVRRFCFSSVYHPSLSLGNHAAKRPVEEAVYDSGLEFTVLQPAMFMQTLDASWADVLAFGTMSGPYRKTAKVSYVDFRDVAEVAARALTEDAMVNGTFELCAAGMVDRVDVAALMSQALGRSVEASETSFADAPVPAGPMRDAIALMMASYDRYGFAGGNAVVLRAVLGREPRTLAQYVAELAAR